jgi:exosortase/archaeosortase family protein
MLWAESYVVMLLACVFKLNLKQTSVLSLVAILIITVGNIVRATSLITFDKLCAVDTVHNLSQWEPSVHTLAGLVVFSAVCGITIMVASSLAARMAPKSETRQHLFAPLTTWAPKLSLVRNVLAPLCVAAALIPCVAHPTGSTVTAQAPPKWPTEINGNKVISVDSLMEEHAFAQDFPGQMKRFTDGTNSYFVRFVQRETRQLHPSSDCFKGLGYQIEPHPMFVAEDGRRWGSFAAVKANSRYLILERIYDESGFSSTDVSEWYWLACLGKTHGPWFDVTIAQPMRP